MMYDGLKPMQDKHAIAFTTKVTEQDWDVELSGWRCHALKIPGAKVESVFVEGNRVDSAWYQVNYELDIVRWARSDRPGQATLLIKLTEELSTKELTLKWKKLAIILPLATSIIVALIAGTFTYMFSVRTHSTDSSNKANPDSACAAQIRITSPPDLGRVEREQTVQGTYENLSQEQQIYIMIYIASVGKYYPQNQAIPQAGKTWFAEALIGLEEERGKSFKIYAVVADKEAQKSIDPYIKNFKDKNDSPGWPTLPKGTEVCDKITVYRVDHP